MLLNFIAAGRGATPDDEFGPDELRSWLSSLPNNDSAAAAQAIIDRLVALNRAEPQGRLRLRLLDMVKDHVDWLLPQLEKRLTAATPPITGPLRQVAYLIEKVLKELAVGYGGVLVNVPRAWLPLGFRKHMQTPLVRAMEFHARRLALSQRLYARNPGAVWAELHQLFALAREWGIETREIESPRTSPLEIYRNALLLAFAQPTKLMPGDCARVQAYLAAQGDLAELLPGMAVEDPTGVFAIDPRRDRPGVAYAKRRDAGFEHGELLLITGKLIERVFSQHKKLREGISPASLGLPDEAARPGYLELMQRLMTHWRGERKQRGARMRFHPRVEVWVGLREIWRVLRAETPSDGNVPETAPRSSQWIIANESSRGFALKYMSGALVPINVGEIVAIRGSDQSAVFVCLVRWIQSNNAEHYELGLQQLAPIVVPAVYKLHAGDRVAPEPALFFPEVPARQQTSVIIVPPDRLRPNEAVHLRHRRGRLSLTVGRVVEKTPSVELIELA